MSEYSKTNLETIIGEKITVQDTQNNTATITLKSVTSNNTGCDEWESFTATYSGDEKLVLEDGCYQFHHDKFDSLQLFISANSENEYETVITQEKK